MTTTTWNPTKKTTYGQYTYSTCGKFSISREDHRKGTVNTVLYADGTQGTTEQVFFALFVHTAGSCEQRGNYRTKREAMAAVESL